MKFHYPLLYQTSFLKAKSREEIRQFLTEYREIKKIYFQKTPWIFHGVMVWVFFIALIIK